MANTYKTLIITPNRASNTADPKIAFRGANTSSNTELTLTMYPDSNGTLSIDGSAGQLFSITNDLSNSIFSVNDVSGIPSIEVFANGVVTLAPISGNVGLGNTTPAHKLRVEGTTSVSGTLILGSALTANGGNGTSGQVLTSNGSGVYWSTSSGGTIASANTTANGLMDITTQTFAGNKTFQNTVAFSANVNVDSGVLFVDTINNRVGVNNSSPSHALRVEGTTSLNGALNTLSTLAVTGATTLSSTLGVTGVATFSANANFDSGVLFVDGVNNRVGVNNTSPTTALEVTGTVTATTFSGSGASLTALNATALSTGTVPIARLDGNVILTTSTTGINASALSTGTVPVARLDSSVILTTSTTGINASALSTGTVPVARLDSSVILTTSTTGINASALSTGTVPVARLTSASTTANGVVDTTTQTFAGDKTFQNAATFSSTVSVSGAANALSTLGVTGTLSALGQLSVTGNATFDTNTLFVDATNDRVGIGNTAPASKLVVSDAGNYQVGITGTSTTAYTQLYLNGTNRAYGVGVAGGSETTYGVADDFFIFDHTAGAMRLVLDINGNIGVGNTSPAHRLRVEGTTSTSGNVAVNSTNTTAYNLFVNGSFAATTKSFSIPHPTDDTKTLRYGSLEGPENGVYVRGRARTNTIILPAYWHALVDEDTITVSVTPNGAAQALWVASVNATHVMIGHDASTSPDYYYHVFAERKDVPRLEVEVSNAG